MVLGPGESTGGQEHQGAITQRKTSGPVSLKIPVLNRKLMLRIVQRPKQNTAIDRIETDPTI
eukprot:7759701-Pyramimonas_sp.AAC.1